MPGATVVGEDKWRPAKVVARDIFAGTIAGINVTLVGHPFDTLKVRLQTQPTNPPVYNGLTDCFKKTLKWEGVGGLYKGVGSPIVGQMFFRANLFLTFAQVKRWLSLNGTRQLKTADLYFAGGCAWINGATVECPIDVVKSQLQVQIIKSKSVPGYVAPYTNMWGCTQAIIRANGFKGLYQGMVPHLLRNGPAGSVHLGTFDLLRNHFAKQQGVPVSGLPSHYNLFAGGVGGVLFWLIFFPVDVIKSSIQTDSLVKAQRKYTGVADCARQLYGDGGWRRFYRGFTPCMMRAVPANAVMMWTVASITDMIKI